MAVSIPPIPHDTILAAKSAFGNEHAYIKVGFGLAEILSRVEMDVMKFSDDELAESFWLFSVATALQHLEDLTDHQMSNATRTRVDLKYALHLPVVFPGLVPYSLCGFRQRLLQNVAEMDFFQQVLDQLEGVVGNTGKTLANAKTIVVDICTINRWEAVTEMMRNAVEALAASHPGWLRSIALPHWYTRYSFNSVQQSRFHHLKNLGANMLAVGKDGQHLLEEVKKSELIHLMNLAEIQILSQAWQCQFEWKSDQFDLRCQTCSNCASRLNSLPGVMSERRPIGETFL